MKQARHLSMLERHVGITASYQDQRAAQSQPSAAASLSQPLVVMLCNRLKRALAAHDPIGTGHARGALTRLALQNHDRLAQAQRAYYRTIALDADA